MSDARIPSLAVHQTRLHEPTDWELALADALEAAFARGAHELEPLVAALNASRIRPRRGGAWTPEIFTATMQELGA